MSQTPRFKKKLIASAVASCALSGLSGFSLAQEEQRELVTEEVMVTGIRGSVMRSMDIKRDATGVVDAISAEDIGEFPDTNLAESLQRITGVSINRENGEGNEVTVRGFGGDNNMITLNGRHMPASSVEGAAASNSRAFSFANLASESVAGVQVYKTGRASVATGGIGATINIETLRPFDQPGLNFSIAGKALHDTTNRTGDDVTPELSGLFSWTTDDERFGVAITGSYQERHSGSAGAGIDNWLTREYDPTDPDQNLQDVDIENAPELGQLWSRPVNLIYRIDDIQRERTNAQLTVQFRPIESLTGTVDYTYAENETLLERSEQSVWYVQGNRTALTFDDNAVATPVVYTEEFTPGVDLTDLSFAQAEQARVHELDSIGLNLEWEANDDLVFTLDYHDSESTSLPNSIRGSEAKISAAAFTVARQTVRHEGDVPKMLLDLDDSQLGTGANGTLGAEDITSTRGAARRSEQETAIQQFQLGGSYEFENGSIDFGVERRSMENNSRYAQLDPIMGDWGGADPNDVPDDLFVPLDFTSEYDADLGGFTSGYDFPVDPFLAWAEARYADQVANDDDPSAPNEFRDFNNGVFSYDDIWHTNRTIEEETEAAYFQVNLEGELGGMATNLVTGLRYEKTDVVATSLIQQPTGILWEDNDDMQVQLSSDQEFFTGKGAYDYLLPSMDFDIEVIDDIKARFSYSKTISRATYNYLTAGAGSLSVGPQQMTAQRGDPGLLPLESDNVDLSVEWYYDEGSYASIGYFAKEVDNFIGTSIVSENQYGLRNPASRDSARYQQALADLEAAGNASPGITQIFDQMIRNEYGLGPSEPIPEQTAIESNSTDALAMFNTEVPSNNRTAEIDGFELAVQHIFGESGFGLQANYTVVNGDVNYDVESLGIQFALIGLSDTANLVAFYDKNDFQARIAWNWRDKFLDDTAAGGNQEPSFTEAYQQVDANVSYDVTDNLTVFAEGINLFDEHIRQHGRTEVQLLNYAELGARYALGARYTF